MDEVPHERSRQDGDAVEVMLPIMIAEQNDLLDILVVPMDILE